MASSWFETEMKRLLMLNQAGQYPPPQSAYRPPPQAEDLIPRLCRESGRWLVVCREGDRYIVQCNDHRSALEITVRDQGEYTVLFQAWFPVRFSLENPPFGLFGRLLLRNLSLHFSRWSLSIGESCEACPTVGALIPRAGLDAYLFNDVSTEIRDEILSFHAELREKFQWAAPSPGNCNFGGGQQVRHAEPTGRPARLTDEEMADQIIREASVRYRLPRPGQ